MDGLMMWMIRTNIDEDDFDYSVAYGGEPRLFSIKIHHGGKFVVEPKREYVGGSVSFVDCCDIDLFDIDVLEEMVKNIGYPPDMVFYFHFKIHGKSIDDGLRHIANPHVIRLLLTTVKLDVEPAANPSSDSRQFRRIYICYAALKRGFKLCGRNLIGIDGAFMKGPYPGQILSAVGVDSNNGIYPVAFALVEAETFKSWEWFLELLGDDLDWDANSHVTFISDWLC